MPSAYGDVPPSRFRLEENGEEYCIGSEVGNYLRLLRGDLYKRYPGLWRRFMTAEEKRILPLLGMNQHVSTARLTLIKASAVDDIMEGRVDKYLTSAENYNVSLHQDAVHHSLSINMNKDVRKGHSGKFPICFDDCDPMIMLHSSCKPVRLIPIRLDMEIRHKKLRDTLIWVKNNVLITPKQIAKILCDDLDLNPQKFVPSIADTIRQQCDQEAFEENDLNESADRLTIIKLNIHIGHEPLDDEYIQNIAEKDNSPEDFAKQLCLELDLGREFIAAVAFSIKDQIFWATSKDGMH